MRARASAFGCLCAVLALALAAPAAAEEFVRYEGPGADAVNARLAVLAAECRSDMDLPLTHDPREVIASVDFNGDGRIDPVLDQSKVGCDGSSVLWSGTGGSPVRIFVSNPSGGWDEHSTGGFAGRGGGDGACAGVGAARPRHCLRRRGRAALRRSADLGGWPLPVGR
jgi:hypothetical protein